MCLLYKGLLTAGAGLAVYAAYKATETHMCPASHYIKSQFGFGFDTYDSPPAFCVALSLYSRPEAYKLIASEQRNSLRGRLFAPVHPADELIWIAEGLNTEKMTTAQKGFIKHYFDDLQDYRALYTRLASKAAEVFTRSLEAESYLLYTSLTPLGKSYVRNVSKTERENIIQYYQQTDLPEHLLFERLLAAATCEIRWKDTNNLKYYAAFLNTLLNNVDEHARLTKTS